MAEERLAFSRISPPDPSEQEYEALHAAVAASTHGRWFLQEYARRHRAADTRLLLDAIQKLERFLSANDSGETPPRLYAQLLDMTKAIAEARADIEASATALRSSSDDQNCAHKLAALVTDLESRLAFLLQAASSVCDIVAELMPSGPLLLCDHSGRTNLPAPVSLYRFAMLSRKAGVVLEPPAEESESETLTLEPLLVRKSGADVHEQEQTQAAVRKAEHEVWAEQEEPADEALARRQLSSEQPDGLSGRASKQLGALSATPSVESQEPDPILEIEQELFAPTHDMVHVLPLPEPAPPREGLGPGRTGHSGSDVASTQIRVPVPPQNPRVMRGSAAMSSHGADLVRTSDGLSRPMARAAANDPLAAIKTMTDEERIALFT